jgi:hypothetical protein
MTKLQLKILESFSGFQAQWINDQELWSSSNFGIYHSDTSISTPKKIFDLEMPFYMRALSNSRLATRTFRLGVRSFLRLSNRTILIIANKCIFRLEGNHLNKVHTLERGIGPLRNGMCEDQKGNVYLGEYFLNNNRACEVKLLKSHDKGKTWDVIQRMKNIRHIHAVQYDPYGEKIWMATGDKDGESFILSSDDDGKSWKELASGSQKYRTVSLLFTDSHIYWGTDAPTIQNCIFRYSRSSGEIEKVAEVNGPVYYSAKTNEGILLFSTGNEGKSEGSTMEWDNTARIWASKDGTHWQDLMKYEKDRWPYILGFGRVLFAQGSSESIAFTTQCVKGFDETTFVGVVTDGE